MNRAVAKTIWFHGFREWMFPIPGSNSFSGYFGKYEPSLHKHETAMAMIGLGRRPGGVTISFRQYDTRNR